MPRIVPVNRIRVGLVGLLLFTPGDAQPADPAFAAASIRPKQNAQNTIFGRVEFKPGGRLTAVAASIFQLVNAAYGLTGS